MRILEKKAKSDDTSSLLIVLVFKSVCSTASSWVRPRTSSEMMTCFRFLLSGAIPLAWRISREEESAMRYAGNGTAPYPAGDI